MPGSVQPPPRERHRRAVQTGTVWTDDTLLARQIAANREAEAHDDIRRQFQVDWSAVAQANPADGRHIEGQIARLGKHHPIVRTQSVLRTVAGGGQFLDATQVDLLLGKHPPEDGPSGQRNGPGAYVAGIDVAGEDEDDPSGEAARVNPRRDSTELTIAYAAQARVNERVLEPTSRWFGSTPGAATAIVSCTRASRRW